MCEEGKVKYTKPRQMTNKGPQDLVPPLRWVICLLGHGSFQIFPCISPFLVALVYL